MREHEFKLPAEGSFSKKTMAVNTSQEDSYKSTESKSKIKMLLKNKSKHPVNSDKKTANP